MHNLNKIKLFGILLWCTYPFCFVVLYPLAMLRKKNKSHLFFFFDRYSVGGAQKIHIDILHSVDGIAKQVFFTRKSVDKSLQHLFYTLPNTKSTDIHFWCDNWLLRLFSVHYFCFYINQHRRAHIFGSNSTYFYDLLPFLHKRVVRTELLHNFTYGKNGMEFFGLANHRFLHHRVIYDNLTKRNIQEQYQHYKVPHDYLNKILFIEPGVPISNDFKKDFSGSLHILYAGRGGPQKRVWLINQIATHFLQIKTNVVFHFAGTMEADLSAIVMQHSIMHGVVSDAAVMQKIYEHCHVILLTSAYEGFPMVIKEGMANGCIPVVTALEGNKTHLTNRFNALLIEEISNEPMIVQQAIEHIETLIQNNELVQALSANSRNYAEVHFNKAAFVIAYKKLLTAT
jgi:glycosyltransferase involved in cell wall biosynthesis